MATNNKASKAIGKKLENGIKTRKRKRDEVAELDLVKQQPLAGKTKQIKVVKNEKQQKSNTKERPKSAKKLDFGQENNNATVLAKTKKAKEKSNVKLDSRTKSQVMKLNKELTQEGVFDDGVKILIDTSEFESSDECEVEEIGIRPRK